MCLCVYLCVCACVCSCCVLLWPNAFTVLPNTSCVACTHIKAAGILLSVSSCEVLVLCIGTCLDRVDGAILSFITIWGRAHSGQLGLVDAYRWRSSSPWMALPQLTAAELSILWEINRFVTCNHVFPMRWDWILSQETLVCLIFPHIVVHQQLTLAPLFLEISCNMKAWPTKRITVGFSSTLWCRPPCPQSFRLFSMTLGDEGFE